MESGRADRAHAVRTKEKPRIPAEAGFDCGGMRTIRNCAILHTRYGQPP